MKVTRRKFLQQSAQATASLTLLFYLPQIARADEVAEFQPNAYIRIGADNVVTLWATRSEMGQGVRTNLPAALADELEVDLYRIKLEQAAPGARFNGIRLRTSGSGSSSGTFTALRKAGATAREMLIGAAAQTWHVARSECRAELGSVIHSPSSRRLSYGELTSAATRQPVPANPALKDAKEFRFIGKPLRRFDGPAIVQGQSTYGLDVRVPGMLFAVVRRCPYLGGKVLRFDGNQALAVAGVRRVVPISSGIFPGVAVVANDTWAAMKGREALTVEWDKGPNRNFDSDRFIDKLKSSFVQEGYPIRRQGDVTANLDKATRRVEAVYEYAFQAHAALETMNCTAAVRDKSCEVWVPTQTPETAHQDIQRMLGLSADAVQVHTTLLGGGFGRRLFIDYVHEAVELSKAINNPVQILWTRDDDMRNGFFHPASVEKLTAAFDDSSNITWLHKSVGSDLSMYPAATEEEKKNLQRYAQDELPWGAFDNPYSFGAMKVDYVPVDSPVPSGPWRAVFYPSRVFARESFIDEIAFAINRDPLQLRVDLLGPGNVLTLRSQLIDRGRMIRVLEIAREKSGWRKPLPPRSNRLNGRGVALNIYQGESYIAQVVEVSIAKDLTNLQVERIVCVVDCGLAINPAGLEGQVESGITWGLSAALHGKIDFREGKAQQASYGDFRVMRMNEMPDIETHIVPSLEPPSGFGEHPVPPVAPAVANALFAATGRRVRRLPFTSEAVAAAERTRQN